MNLVLPLVLIFYIFLVIFIFSLLITGTYLLLRAFQVKLKNLYFMAFGLVIIAVGYIGRYAFNLGNNFEEIFVSSGFILIVIFTNQTFHKNRNSQGIHILIIIICLAIFMVVFHAEYVYFFVIEIPLERSPFTFYLKQGVDLVFTFLTFAWMSWSSNEAFKKLKNQDMQPWIKARYKLISISSFLISLEGIPEMFRPWNVPSTEITHLSVLIIFGITAILAMICALIFILAWFMPNSLKNYYNKDFSIIEDEEFSEEELLKILSEELKKRK